MDVIELMVSVDENYLGRLRTMLLSAYINNATESFRVHVLHSGITEEARAQFVDDMDVIGFDCAFYEVDDELLADAPVSERYPREMYFRFVASLVLPEECERVLYLDPDILVINELRPLWGLDLEGKAFAAAAHTQKTDLGTYANNIRLNTERPYYNSGVFVMDVRVYRELFSLEDMYACIEERRRTLLLPDQDLFNVLYEEHIHPIDDAVWNYDARNFSTYLLRSGGEADTDWVLSNTAILHFCGSPKPWDSWYRYRFGVLYKHYDALAKRWFA